MVLSFNSPGLKLFPRCESIDFSISCMVHVMVICSEETSGEGLFCLAMSPSLTESIRVSSQLLDGLSPYFVLVQLLEGEQHFTKPSN